MQKAFNGSITVIEEFAAGNGAVDICAVSGNRRFPVELKIRHRGYTEAEGVRQLRRCMDTRLAVEGWLVASGRKS
jgi:hypothetical protein